MPPQLLRSQLRYAGSDLSGLDVGRGGMSVVLAGPGREPVRGARRVNAVLTAVRGFVVHAVTSGGAPARLLPLIYELADDRDLPEQARGEDRRMAWRMRARHRLHEPHTAVDRASDEEIVALLMGCRSARDRLMVLLMSRAGLGRRVTPHQLRHAFGSNIVDAGGTLDEVAELLGHASMSSSQVYLHPDPTRLRDAVERIPSPRGQAGVDR